MGRWHFGIGHWIVAAGLIAHMGLLPVLYAQQVASPEQKTSTPTLADILQRLQENMDQYQAEVPSFFCDEHVVSTIIPDPKGDSTVTDSTFRLKRMANPEAEGKTKLEESHEVKMVNGRPATGDTVGGPGYLRGAFSNGLTMVTLNKQACMHYKLRPIRQNKSNEPIVIEFASLPKSKRPDDCQIQEDLSGRVQVDPVTMQVMRLEFTVPHHLFGTTVIHASTVNSELGLAIEPIEGPWNVTVVYAAVELGGKSFRLPMKISDTMISSSVRQRWTYDATYSNYHKLEVTSRILPGSEASAP